MPIAYTVFQSIPNDHTLEAIHALHEKIFGASEDLLFHMQRQSRLLILIALDDTKLIGYKLGYERDRHTFYSWLGGVDPRYRNKGVATTLMEKQHSYAKEQGYRVIQTKTMNNYRSMLLLNIKYGFDIIETYTNQAGDHKIVLEKRLEASAHEKSTDD